jgi:hypothetical protein
MSVFNCLSKAKRTQQRRFYFALEARLNFRLRPLIFHLTKSISERAVKTVRTIIF